MKRTSKGASAPALKPAPVVRLHKPEDNSVDQDYVDSIRAMLRRAESGQSIGVAYVEITSNKGYFPGALGMADENPTFCLGMVEVLKAKLLKKVMG